MMQHDPESPGDPRPDFLPPPRPDAGFRIPEGYFDALQEQVLSQVQQIKAAPHAGNAAGILLHPVRRLRMKLALAASLLLLIAAAIWVWNARPGEAPAPQLAALSEPEIQAYLLQHADEFEAELVLQAQAPVEVLPLLETQEVQDQTLEPLLLDEIEALDEQSLETLFL